MMLLFRMPIALALVVVAAVVPSFAAAQPPTPGVDAGDVVVVDAINTDRELTEFTSTAAFRLRLPDDATCPGDSANDDYRVQTFLVPAETDLTTLTYRNRSPDGNDLYRALRYTDGEVSTQVMTNQNPGPNEPGLILNYRVPFTFAYYNENTLPPGRWKIGIACTPVPGWNVEKFWEAEVILEETPEVLPGGLTIRTVASDGTAASSSDNGIPVLPLTLGGVLIVGAIAFYIQRSSRKPAPTTKEHQ